MKPDVLVVGCGMYVVGHGENDFGTILPTLLQSQKSGDIGKIYIASTSEKSAKYGQKKCDILSKKMCLQPEISFFPESGDDSSTYLKVASQLRNGSLAIVSVPDHLHYEVTEKLLNLKIHCLVVKPLTPTVKEAAQLCRKQSESNVVGAVEFHKRFDQANMLIKNAFENGRIGDLIYIIVEYSQRKIIPTEVFKSWAEKSNIFQYLGVHYVDLIYYITQAKPKKISATGQKNLLNGQGIDSFDAIQVNIEWELNGKRFNSILMTNWIDSNKSSAMSDQAIKLIGTKGRIESDQKNRGLQIVDDSNIEDVNPYFSKLFIENDGAVISGYGPESIFNFISFATKSKGRIASFKEALISTAVLEACCSSLSKGGEWIEIDLKEFESLS